MNESAMVFDTSAVMAVFLQENEGKEIEQDLKKLLEVNGQLFVPSLFWYETGNTLITVFRGKRITKDELRGIEADLAALPFVTDPLPDAYIRQRIRELALEKKLTYSDASYVELARRLQLPLRSFDRKILRAMS